MSDHGMSDLEVVIKAARKVAVRHRLEGRAETEDAFFYFADELQSILDANKPTVQPEQDEQEERK